MLLNEIRGQTLEKIHSCNLDNLSCLIDRFTCGVAGITRNILKDGLDVLKQDERGAHRRRRCSFHGLTSVTVQSGWVFVTHIITIIITIPQCSFSLNKCGLVADKKPSSLI